MKADKMDRVHVISKSNNNEHAVFDVPRSSATVELPPSSILVRTELISLTSNNLSYARGGTMLRWWDSYPAPSSSPPPYNDTSLWGIVPAWGYANVLQSTTSIPCNSLIWGFWPTSTTAVQLQLKAAGVEGHWIETSPHRQKLMTIYNRYIIQKDSIDDEKMGWTALFRGVWQGAYLLNKYVFSYDKGIEPVHPLGLGGTWTAGDADLRSAVVVSMSASSKTARSFTYHVSSRRPESGPLGLLQVTAEVGMKNVESRIETETVAYGELKEGVEWISALKAEKVVVVDFGAREHALVELLESIKSNDNFKNVKVVILQIGSQQKVYTPDEMLATRENMVKLGKIQYNTAGIQDTIMARYGEKKYFDDMDTEWEKWLAGVEQNTADMQIVWGDGVEGGSGIEGGWERLCAGNVGSKEGLVYRL